MKLSEAIGKDILLFENKQYVDDDFLKMSSEELATFKAKLNVKITNLADIIKEHRNVESAEWYKRKKYVISLYNKMLPYINSILQQRHKAERSLGDYFQDQAKLNLSVELYELLLIKAEREYKKGREILNVRK